MLSFDNEYVIFLMYKTCILVILSYVFIIR